MMQTNPGMDFLQSVLFLLVVFLFSPFAKWSSIVDDAGVVEEAGEGAQ